ncbi:MAG TPA: acetyl-CoA C-acyltransferase [Alphaproteobacteria bacterium]|nr:acetyl-CoA C-acyltransferase [Alphaproteobacteria bacterium]
MKTAVIVEYLRSPFARAGKGDFVEVRPDDLAASVVSAIVKKSGINTADIEDLKMGCAFPEGEQGLNIGKQVGFIANLPLSVAGVTTNRFCGSSMQTIHDAVGAIVIGAGDVFICAGVESMSRIPMGGMNPGPNPELFEKYPETYDGMGATAERLAVKYKISRKEQEEFAVASHQKAAKAQAGGKFKDEIVPYKNVEKDGCIRADTSLETLANLKPAFDAKGTVTAGTSSPLTDGASAVIVTSEDYARKNNLKILARIKSIAVAGCAPEIMGIGPVPATKKALARAGLELKDIDIIELNEAFSAQSISVIKELELDINKINLDGGAIALGHPLGASGARITGKAASLLSRENKKYALATMCIGGGQGIATVLERV